MKHRLISALILIPTVLGVLFLLPPMGFATVVLVICMIAAWEWGKLSCITLNIQRVLLTIFCGLLLALMLFTLPSSYHYIHQPLVIYSLWLSIGWWFIALQLILFYPCSARVWRNSKLLRLIFGLLIIVPFFLSMLALRTWHYNDNRYLGSLWLLYVMILVWGVDSGAYMFGKWFGSTKLVPKISPRKTWQGFIGGLIMAAISSQSYSFLVNLKITGNTLLICSIFSILASVLGDLTESMFKREAGIKESGHLIPGHGGILDRIDSLVAAVPIFTCLLLLVFRTI